MEHLIGMDFESAKKELQNLPWRVAIIDGKGCLGTCDYNPERTNLETKDGIVIRAYKG